MYSFKQDDVIVLLGAGASVEAEIPHSARMILEVEKEIDSGKWSEYKNLYNYIRSAIYFSDGLQGRFDNRVNYNIERLVNTLDELNKRSDHPLYPFVGSWNPTLVDVAGADFRHVSRFRDSIVEKLKSEWLAVSDYSGKASYYKGLVRFKNDLNYPLRIFTLNYDLCVEKTCSGNGIEIERGFNEKRIWDWRQFDDSLPEKKAIYLYKLHGSVDWKFNSDDTLSDTDDRRADMNTALIFGTSYKLQYRDPFLFQIYEFRKWTLASKIIVAIGYGFGDEHINRILLQALGADKNRILLAVYPNPGPNNLAGEEEQRRKILTAIESPSIEQVKFCSCHASEFLQEKLTLELLADLLPPIEQPFPTLST